MKAPTLIVWGDKDRIVPLSTAKRYLAALPNAKLEVIKDCGHCVDLEQPEQARQARHALHRRLSAPSRAPQEKSRCT